MTESRFDTAYQGGGTTGSPLATPPWEIGRPQPAVVRLEEAGLIGGQVLDAGCGTGENALYLAERGHKVTGVDIAPTAIAAARDKAAGRGLDVPFEVADAVELAGYDDRFDTVLDVGLFHSLDPAGRDRYLAALHRVCRTGATVYLLCISDRARIPGPHLVDEKTLRDAFADGWTLHSLRPEVLEAVLPGGPRELETWLAVAQRD
ncbi:class I SAM-dependent methyltransferase [Planomonospora venezuelensis]|uniref:SAM-dependent methyltransferase n=1 Tax=Planomonospora venezuelensis TaxID=1999 RepID=A0A841D2N8_PLAVE|nr:class I SAM-dependent methyltransferase [Planomonospora venezuelensis]MBB5962435.1 SAM-dependent methyltransferase [Planomonospora venezuelensis]GIN00817.1 transferase [Planomonospora venezuelensis]